MLHDWFIGSVQRFPAELALITDGSRLTYAQLDAVSRGIGRRLRAEGADRPRVGLLTARTVAAYAGYLATLRAGGVVVPLDAGHPPERLSQVTRSAGLEFMIADRKQDTAFLDGSPLRVLRIGPETVADFLGPTVTDDEPDWSGAPDEVAYLLFTSGSTGRPKGVPIRHGNLEDFLRFNIARYEVGPGSRVAQMTHQTFDPSVLEMFMAWGAGATLVVPSADELFDPVTFVNRHQITHMFSVPSLITMTGEADLLPPGSMPSLRWSLFGGEKLTPVQARAWAGAAPDTTLENLYGPTECTVAVTAYRLPADPAAWPVTANGTIPIGQVYPHLEYRIEADGELLVRGSQRFSGYHDATDNVGRFADPAGSDPDPSSLANPVGAAAWYRTGDRVAVQDGALVHLGRLDHQIKIRGNRVELHEVEGAIRIWAGAADVVVHLVSRPDGMTELAAACVGQVPALPEFRERLREHLPLHMIPGRLIRLERLPLNERGKVDRMACAALLEAEAATP
jgi:amino acid adenylation domain-containing protein